MTSLPSGAISLQIWRIQPGDSWWKLYARYLGSGSHWTELLCVNPGVTRDPGRLPAGIYVFVPGNARTRPAAPRTSMAEQKGDNFLSLAREHLGGGQFWPQLAAANPEITQIHQAEDRHKTQTPRKRGPHRHKARQHHHTLTV
jgi:hypothetical protein